MPLNIMFTYPTLLISYVYTELYIIYCILSSLCNTCITSHFKLFHFYVSISYITHLICIYCTLYHPLHLAYAVLYHRSSIYLHVHILIHSFTLVCVYKVVVVKMLDYLLDITALSELEAQTFHYTHINIC